MSDSIIMVLGVLFSVGLLVTAVNIESTIGKMRRLLMPEKITGFHGANKSGVLYPELWKHPEQVEWNIEDKKGNYNAFINALRADLLLLFKRIDDVKEIAKESVHEKAALRYLEGINVRVRKFDISFEEVMGIWHDINRDLKYEVVQFDKIIDDVGRYKSRIDLRIQYERNPENEFWGDYLHTKLILQGIFNHAFIYSEPQQRRHSISVYFRKSNSLVLIEVIDNNDTSIRSQEVGISYYLVESIVSRIKGTITQHSGGGGKGKSYKLYLHDAQS